MTREELKEKFSKDITRVHSYGFNGEEIRELVGTEFDIDGIIDYVEALQLKITEIESQLIKTQLYDANNKQCVIETSIKFEDIVKEHNLKTFSSSFSNKDIELPYVFDLLWDIKSIGHLDYALNSEYLHCPSNDIYETMATYGLTKNNVRNYYEPKGEQ